MRMFALILFVFLNISLRAQDKFEREFQIDRKEVPAQALAWFDAAFSDAVKVHWYYEESSGKITYEAKCQRNDVKYSVEFDSAGFIEDIESAITWKDIPENAAHNMEQYFQSDFSRHKLLKIQLQCSGSPENLREYMVSDNLQGITVKYEIEFQGRKGKENELWEGLFSDDGKPELVRKIILAPTDHIEF